MTTSNDIEPSASSGSLPRSGPAVPATSARVSLSERRSRAYMARKLRPAPSERSSPAQTLTRETRQSIAEGVRWAFDEGWRDESLVRVRLPPYRATWGTRPNAAEMATALIVWARDKGKNDGE